MRTQIFFVLLFLVSATTQAQLSAPNARTGKSLVDPLLIYDSANLNFFTICNGRIYVEEDKGIHGDRYFSAKEAVPGEVNYQGKILKCLVLYDIYHRKILTECNGRLIELTDEKLDNFSFGDHRFIKLGADGSMNRDFYEIMYEGKIKFYAKRQKTVSEKEVERHIKKEFIEKDKYFIYLNGNYHPIRNRSSLFLQVEDSKKKMLRKKVKAGRIDFNENWEKAVQQFCIYYDQLSE